MHKVVSVGLILTALVACEGAESLPEISCEDVSVDISDDECNVVAEGCADDRLHELLCLEYANGDGTYDQRLICECAEDQAVHGETIIEGEQCGSVQGNTAAIEAAFRACDRELVLP